MKKIFNLFANLLFNNKLVILTGSEYFLFAVIKNGKLIDSLWLANDDKISLSSYQDFLKKHKKCPVIFLLNDTNCHLQQETAPIFGAALNKNPIKNFIDKHFSDNTITAYQIYDTNNLHEEIWHYSLASYAFLNPLKQLLHHVLCNSFKYGGTYFLSLNFKYIINYLLQNQVNSSKQTNLELFVTITKTSGILLAVKYKKQILDTIIAKCPHDKSSIYIQGTIEQEVNNLLIKHKDFIKQHHLDISIITFSNAEIQNLLANSDFKESGFTNYQILALHIDDIEINDVKNDSFFQDINLLKLINYKNRCLASNYFIRSITKLSLINKIFFKPLFILIFCAFFGLLWLKYNDVKLSRKIASINENYYNLSKKYQDISYSYPGLANTKDLIELYNLKKITNQKITTPLPDLQKIYNPNFPNIKIKQLIWQKSGDKDIIHNNEQINITIYYEHKIDKTANTQNMTVNTNYIQWLSKIFDNYELDYEQDKQKKYIARKIITPMKVMIKKSVEKN